MNTHGWYRLCKLMTSIFCLHKKVQKKNQAYQFRYVKTKQRRGIEVVRLVETLYVKREQLYGVLIINKLLDTVKVFSKNKIIHFAIVEKSNVLLALKNLTNFQQSPPNSQNDLCFILKEQPQVEMFLILEWPLILLTFKRH